MTTPTTPQALSKCCSAPVKTECGVDFGQKDDNVTCYMVCQKCHLPCDAIYPSEDGAPLISPPQEGDTAPIINKAEHSSSVQKSTTSAEMQKLIKNLESHVDGSEFEDDLIELEARHAEMLCSHIRTLERENKEIGEANDWNMNKAKSLAVINQRYEEALGHIWTVIDWHPAFNVMGESAEKIMKNNKPLCDVVDIADKAIHPFPNHPPL